MEEDDDDDEDDAVIDGTMDVGRRCGSSTTGWQRGHGIDVDDNDNNDDDDDDDERKNDDNDDKEEGVPRVENRAASRRRNSCAVCRPMQRDVK